MADILAAIEGLPPVLALKSSFVAYPLVNALHILLIGALVTSVLLMDLRVLGAFGSVPAAPFVALLRRVAFVAFAGAVLTGATLFAVRARDYAASPVFLLKMVLVAIAILNFLLFRRLEARVAKSGNLPAPLRLQVIFSAALWLCVLVAGRFIGFY
ncbi:hypothetical protein [Mesorhizobium sp. L-8-3]|uniref:hypothetical protein n=1 Tax=Mesorhizobium sp. L-8-3 TaxID=2744522 RepID=UPI0019277491|nr:hypothetical protein [Mesorhizobium sp. L-8-3]BCH22037.1 hypothetical protein MesoLjLb_18220 [Mesorhizobium sp. L-8-3]